MPGLCRECKVSINDTVDSIYKSFMYPEGIKAMAEAVKMIAEVNILHTSIKPGSTSA